ncbi:MAG: S8 family serine peptidase [Gaiellaceae bacterium]
MRRKLILLVVTTLFVPAATLQAASLEPTTSVLVHFNSGTNAAAQNALIERVGGRRTSTVPRLGTAVVSVPLAEKDAALTALERLPGVEYAETNGTLHAYDVTVNDPYLDSSSWPLANPLFPAAWSLTTGSPNTVVAVIDTGVQLNHPDLGTFVPGYDFVNNDSDPSDDGGHGTAVAGIIAGQGNNGLGIVGTCWGCRIMPVKVLGASGFGSDSAVAAGIVWAVDHGAGVINLSLGGASSSQTLADAVTYAQNHSVVVVAAAGNDSEWQVPSYPAAYPGVISVGAIDEDGYYYLFSNWGSWVMVDAPGCTNTTHLSDSVRPDSLYYNLGSPYASYYTTPSEFCGTSAAAPFVAGLAGLARSYNPSASAYSVASAIEQTANPRPPVFGEGNSLYGSIDAVSALQTVALAPAGPQASFAPSAIAGIAPLTVNFSNSSTNTTSQVWTFGDGTTSSEISPLHVFGKPGTYTVTLLASRSPGENTTATATITVRPDTPAPPIASFTVSRASGSTPLTVTFTNHSSRAASYLWSFGDRTPLSGEISPEHTFTATGVHEVTLTAMGTGGTVTTTKTVEVTSKVVSKATSKPDLKVSLTRTAARHSGRLHLDSLVVTLSNRGRVADTNVKLRIALPAASGVRRVSTGGGRCALVGRRMTCSFGTLAGQRTVRAKFVVRHPSGAKTNVSASGARSESSLANNSASLRSS